MDEKDINLLLGLMIVIGPMLFLLCTPSLCLAYARAAAIETVYRVTDPRTDIYTKGDYWGPGADHKYKNGYQEGYGDRNDYAYGGGGG